MVSKYQSIGLICGGEANGGIGVIIVSWRMATSMAYQRQPASIK